MTSKRTCPNLFLIPPGEGNYADQLSEEKERSKRSMDSYESAILNSMSMSENGSSKFKLSSEVGNCLDILCR